MLRGRSAAIAAVVAVAAASLVSGCGGGSGTQSALSLDPVAAAAAKTQNAGAARIRFSMAVSGMQGKSLQMRGSGAIDGTSSEMSFKLGSMVGQMGIPSPALKKLAHSSLKAISLVENGDYVMYMHLGFLSSQIPGGKPWIKLALSKLGKQAGLDLGSMLSGGQFEPTDLLALLRAEGAKVHKVGAATIDGAATTHYRVTVDLAKALRSKGLASPMLKGIAAHMKSVSDDVWIGKDGLVRRIRAAYSMPTLPSSPRMAMTMNLYDYGAHVTIAAPPSSEVFDATQLAQAGIGSSLP